MMRFTWDPLVLGVLVVTSVLYVRGVSRLWRRAGDNHGVKRWQVAAFTGGQVALFLGLISPLDGLSDILFSAHMTQHELIIIVAAPLIVLGRALLVFLWGLPEAWREPVARWTQRPLVHGTWRAITGPFVVLVVHAIVVWVWHIPRFFEAALASEPLHAFQHVGFFVTSALFWWALVYGRYGRAGYGVAILYVFATMMHTSILGAMLGLGATAWYPTHAARTHAFGMDPVDDQQLAGLIMWIPAGIIFLAAALGFFVAWMGEAERRAAKKAALLSTTLLLVLTGCNPSSNELAAAHLTGGDPAHGKMLIRAYGCGSCHTIPGVAGANTTVGPSLEHIARRTYLAGHLPNAPETMARWVQHPSSVDDASAMPEMGVTDKDAQDITAYLYTLR